MPRNPERQRAHHKRRYMDYKALLERLGEQPQWNRWSRHYTYLREHTPADVPPVSAAARVEGQPELGVWCVTCQEWCLPLDSLAGICGFCNRLPASGLMPDHPSVLDEERKRRWMRASHAYRDRKKEAAA